MASLLRRAGRAPAHGSNAHGPSLLQQTIACIREAPPLAAQEAGGAARRVKSFMTVHLRGLDKVLVEAFGRFISETVGGISAAADRGSRAGSLGTRIERLPYTVQKWSVLASPHVHKTAWAQYERRTHHQRLTCYGAAGASDAALELGKRLTWYFQQHAPPDVHFEARLHEYIPLAALATSKETTAGGENKG